MKAPARNSRHQIINSRLRVPLLAIAFLVSVIVLPQNLSAQIPRVQDDPEFTPIEEIKKNGWIGFGGKISAVDAKAGTFTVAGRAGKRLFFVTAQSRITKQKRPATLKDVMVGDEVGGETKINAEGKAIVIKAGFGHTDYPTGRPVPGKRDMAFSPYAPTKEVSIAGIPKGALVKCPYTGKPFRAP